MARNRRPIKVITLDTETYNGLIGDIKRIAVYDGSKVNYGYRFTDVEHVLTDYQKQGYKVVCYIHNMEFDLRKMPEVFDKILWNKCFMINGKLVRVETKKYTFQDSFRLLPSSLDSLSKDFEVTHAKVDLWDEVQRLYPDQYTDKVDFLDRCDKDNELYMRYLGYDVISLYEVIFKLIDLTGLSLQEFTDRMTTASLSRYLFKTGYKGKPFKIWNNEKTDYEFLCSYNWKNDLETESFIRNAYCGGRVEVFKMRLDRPGYHYDVNSLYPYVMSAFPEYPIGRPYFTDKPAMAEHYFTRWQRDHVGLGFINCKVFIPQQNIPPLPVKMGKLCFPCGEIYGTWTYEELDYAVRECGVKILEYYAVCHFKNTYPVFKNFIETFYQLKEQATEEGNKSLRTLAKLIMNVAYGYTGMRRDDKTSLAPYADAYKHDKIVFANAEMGFIEIPTEITAEYIQVQVAATVTSRARLVLLQALREADARGNVYYCDTDSCVTDVPFPPEICHPSHLGKWDCESRPVKALFLKPKVYAEVFEDGKETKKFKGVSKETQRDVLCYESYEHLYEDLEDQKKKYVVVEKNRITLRSIMYMEKQGLPLDTYETRDKKMNLNTVEKRKMFYDENRTEPLYFHTEDDFTNFNFKPIKPVVEFDMTAKHYKGSTL